MQGWLASQSRHRTGQVRGDRARGDPENLGGGPGVQVQEHPQRDNLALAGRQPLQRGEDSGIHSPGRHHETPVVSAARTTHPRGAE